MLQECYYMDVQHKDIGRQRAKRKQAVACFRNGPLKNFTTCHKDQRCQDRIWPFPIGVLWPSATPKISSHTKEQQDATGAKSKSESK